MIHCDWTIFAIPCKSPRFMVKLIQIYLDFRLFNVIQCGWIWATAIHLDSLQFNANNLNSWWFYMITVIPCDSPRFLIEYDLKECTTIHGDSKLLLLFLSITGRSQLLEIWDLVPAPSEFPSYSTGMTDRWPDSIRFSGIHCDSRPFTPIISKPSCSYRVLHRDLPVFSCDSLGFTAIY